MNFRLVSKLLGIVCLLIAGAMALSLPWALPALGRSRQFELRGFLALVGAILAAVAAGVLLSYFGRGAHGQLFQREAMATVALSWFLATLLGAIPFALGRILRDDVHAMNLMDAVFESASGFTGTGATVLSELEDPDWVPRCVLFWRSETHFLGGLGIMVLFVAILGRGSAGKALMRSEMAGPVKQTRQKRVQHAAWTFSYIYIGLNAALTFLLVVQGMPLFDALCHAFGTIATGGFGTRNSSIAAFHSLGIEMTIALFMVVACVNFALIHSVVILQPGRLWRDTEFCVYLTILAAASLLVISSGLYVGDFLGVGRAFRYGFFQVASILTNTGFATTDFNRWNQFNRGLLVLLMFIGGCAGSTSCSVKVIRYILLFKILRREIERFFHPTVVRPLRIAGDALDDGELTRNILVYFALVAVIFAISWLLLLAIEPDATWVDAGFSTENKLVDCASGVAATLNGVGPGLGTVGATRNFGDFTVGGKLIFTALMLLGRLEILVILSLFMPSFWRRR